MAEDVESDASVGSKRRSVEVPSPLSSTSISAVSSGHDPRQLPEALSSLKEVQESIDTSPKKPKCFSLASEEDRQLGFGCHLEKFEICAEQVREKDDAESAGEFFGTQESDSIVHGDGCSVIEGYEKENQAGFEYEALLEAEKRRLLAELEVGTIFELNGNSEATGGVEGIDFAARRSLKIEVIDDTALIEPFPLCGIEDAEGNAKKNGKQEVDGRKSRRSRRKARNEKKNLGASEKHYSMFTQVVGGPFTGRKNGDQTRIMYSRQEIEALRFIEIVEQRKLWREIYTGLGSTLKREYDDLAGLKKVNPCKHNGRKEAILATPSVVAVRGTRNYLNIFVH